MDYRVDVMLDLETLGTKPGCVVLQIGAIFFRRKSGKVMSEFQQNIDIGSQLGLGMTIDPKTLEWWREQSPAAQASVFSEGIPLRYAVQLFLDRWAVSGCDYDETRVWARGADFDPPIWNEAMRRSGEGAGYWRYNNVRDTRTAFDVLGFNPRGVERVDEQHTALADAAHDFKCFGEAGLWGDTPE